MAETVNLPDLDGAGFKTNQRVIKLAIVLLLFTVAFLYRLVFLNSGFFHHDSVLLADAVKESIQKHKIIPFLEGRHFYVLLHIPIYWLAKLSALPIDYAFNFMTAFIAVASVILIFLFAHKILDETVSAVFVAVLFCFMPIYVSVTTHAMVHAYSVFFVLLSFLFFIYSCNRNGVLLLVLSSLSFAASVSIRFSNLFILPSFVWLFANAFLAGRKDSHVLKKQTIVFALSLAAGLLFVSALQWRQVLLKSKYDEWLGLFSPAIGAGAQTLIRNMGPVGFAMFIVGMLLSVHGHGKKFAGPLVLWFLVLFFYYGNLSTYDERFFCELLPPLTLFSAITLGKLYKISKWGTTLIGVLLILNMIFTVLPIVEDRHRYSGEKEYALWVGRMTPENALVMAMDDFVFIRFYANRQTVEHPVNSSIHEAEEWAEELAAEIREKNIPFYAIESAFAYDQEKTVANALLRHFHFILVGSHLTEDYHKATLTRHVYHAKLIKLEPRQNKFRPVTSPK